MKKVQKDKYLPEKYFHLFPTRNAMPMPLPLFSPRKACLPQEIEPTEKLEHRDKKSHPSSAKKSKRQEALHMPEIQIQTNNKANALRRI